jgi:small subunit ribosomal protein S4
MGRYTGPKGRINRRIGAVIFENAGAMRAFEHRDYPPGQYGKRKKLSDYGVGLREKQKIKYYYGFREEQLRRFFQNAKRMPGNTGENLLIMCECRLDNAVRRAGFTLTRMQARQGVVHRHFQVNGETCDRPSYQLKAGDVITVRNRPNLIKYYKELIDANSSPSCDWLRFDKDNLRAEVAARPTAQDVSLPVEVGQVVAFMSR